MKYKKILPKARNTIKAGEIPGTLSFVGSRKTENATIQLFDFDKNQVYEDDNVQDLSDLKSRCDKATTTWFNVNGIHDAKLMQHLGDQFNIHQLVLEDIMNTNHRPKVEEYEGLSFVVLKMLNFNEKNSLVESEQVSLVLMRSVLISFQERPGDVFDPIRERIRKSLGRVREKGTDYLAYLLLDIIIDNYFNIVEILGEQLEGLENRVIENPSEKLLHELQGFKHEVMMVRRAIYPLREMLRSLSIGESEFVEKGTLKYYRDAYDHSISVIDSIDSFIEISNSIRDLYMSNMSNKMNKIMKVLTIMASIFIPLTFVAGIYGMNFEHMPELSMEYGYPAVLGVMGLMTLGMMIYFKRKDWF